PLVGKGGQIRFALVPPLHRWERGLGGEGLPPAPWRRRGAATAPLPPRPYDAPTMPLPRLRGLMPKGNQARGNEGLHSGGRRRGGRDPRHAAAQGQQTPL